MLEQSTNKEPPLTDKEVKEIRKILESNKRMKWLQSISRKVLIWAAALIGTISVGWEALVRFVLHVAGK